jgi:hypothetical protein
MQKSKGRIIYLIIGALGVVAAVMPLSVYHFIEMASAHNMGGMSMSMACQSACAASVVIGAVIAAVAILSLFGKNTKLEIGSSALLLVGGVAVIVAPRILGFCSGADMACRYLTAPTLTLLGAAIIVLSAVRLVGCVLTIRRI